VKSGLHDRLRATQRDLVASDTGPMTGSINNQQPSTIRGEAQRNDVEDEWRHLERAHVLRQPMAVPHVRTHVAMLGYGLRRRDRQEIIGQLVRLVVAAPGTWTGRYPVGNTGGANVSALKPMSIPEDLRAVLNGLVITPAVTRTR
jgi:hypothetical protein